MSKVNQLRQILVIGATLTLTRSLVDQVESRSEHLNEDLLVIGATDEHFETMVAKPKSAAQHGTRRMLWPLEDEIVEISEEGFTTKVRFGDKAEPITVICEYKVTAKKEPAVAQAEEPAPPADAVLEGVAYEPPAKPAAPYKAKRK